MAPARESRSSEDSRAKAVLEVIRDPSAASRVAEELGVGTGVVETWKKRFIEGGRAALKKCDLSLWARVWARVGPGARQAEGEGIELRSNGSLNLAQGLLSVAMLLFGLGACAVGVWGAGQDTNARSASAIVVAGLTIVLAVIGFIESKTWPVRVFERRVANVDRLAMVSLAVAQVSASGMTLAVHLAWSTELMWAMLVACNLAMALYCWQGQLFWDRIALRDVKALRFFAENDGARTSPVVLARSYRAGFMFLFACIWCPLLHAVIVASEVYPENPSGPHAQIALSTGLLAAFVVCGFAAVLTVQGRSRRPYCFISYSNEDRALVSRIQKHLRRWGIRCWVSNAAMGESLSHQLRDAIVACDRFVVVYSAALEKKVNSAASGKPGWILQENEHAITLHDYKSPPFYFKVVCQGTDRKVVEDGLKKRLVTSESGVSEGQFARVLAENIGIELPSDHDKDFRQCMMHLRRELIGGA